MTALQSAFSDRPYTITAEPAERHNRVRITVRSGETVVGTGTYFRGSHHIAPWIEFKPAISLDPADDAHQELFAAFTELLDPGSHIMVHYLQDTTTADALTADVPPPATPIGYLLWQAGVRWYKDWYFTEGWMEGSQKLQGNLPVDAAHQAEREQDWCEQLRQFCAADTGFRNCQKRARQLLEQV